jgi:hypothetical protein
VSKPYSNGQFNMLSTFHLRKHNESHRRCGAVSIWAIACLMFVTALTVTLGRLALMGSRHMIQERRRSQADWLAHSGWSLATAQLERNADYKGETWEVPASELGGADGGRVKIEITPAEGEKTPEAREISIVAEFPASSDHRVRSTRRGIWQPPQPSAP